MRTRFILTLAALLGGCTVGPNYQRPALVTPDAYTQAAANQPATQPDEQPVDLDRWWTVFDDPTLDSLIQAAGDANLDIRLAQARVREARAFRGVVAADDDIQVDAVGDFNRARTSENVNDGPGGFSGETSNLWETGFDARWEIDLFGRVRRSVEAADADIEAREADVAATLVTVLAETARAYVDLRAFQRRLEIAHDNIRTQTETRDLSKALFDAGLRSEFDVARSEAQLSLTQSQIPALETGAEQAIHRLGILLGRHPGALREELLVVSPIPDGPTTIPPGLPAELLRRRPDLLAAERDLAAATARIGAATADLYPRVTLLGSLGLAAEDLENLVEGGSRTWGLGPRISWPLFDGGRIRANIAVEDARASQALYNYEQTVLISLREVEDALVAHAKEQVRRESLASAVQADRRAVDLAGQLYRGGLGDFLSVLDSERSLYASEDQLIQSEAQVTVNLIALYKALGGGWDPETLPFNRPLESDETDSLASPAPTASDRL